MTSKQQKSSNVNELDSIFQSTKLAKNTVDTSKKYHYVSQDMLTTLNDGIEVIVAATLEKAIDILASESLLADMTFLDDFVFIFRYFI